MNENFKAPRYVWRRDNSGGTAIICGLEAWFSKSCCSKNFLVYKTVQTGTAAHTVHNSMDTMVLSGRRGKAAGVLCWLLTSI